MSNARRYAINWICAVSKSDNGRMLVSFNIGTCVLSLREYGNSIGLCMSSFSVVELINDHVGNPSSVTSKSLKQLRQSHCAESLPPIRVISVLIQSLATPNVLWILYC